MFLIPDDFKRKTLATHGNQRGTAWLERLPQILATCEERWQIKIGTPFETLSFHYATTATQADGTPAVVKVLSPTKEFIEESTAIRLWDGHGMAQLLELDEENEAMLLERLLPGRMLLEIEDDTQATIYAAGVMRQLWRPVPEQHPFDTVQDWFKGYGRIRARYADRHGPFPPALLDEGETLYRELCASMDKVVLLHGDLHHYNILSATRAPWLAIDPKGLIGEATYETAAYLRNPMDLMQRPDPKRILKRRIAILADELAMERQRIRDWAVAHTVLSVCWWIEDIGTFRPEDMEIAQLLASVKP
jgi:streptomycin 6-kinase